MNWNQLIFDVFPYVALTLAVAGTVFRWRAQPFTVSALSSQLLERRKLYWGSVAFHWGISILLLAHLAILILPRAVERWNQVPMRLYALEIAGVALAVWTLVGLGILVFRRLSEPKVKAVTGRMDLALLAVLVLQVVTGLWIALGYRFGSLWAPAVFVPYIRSVLSLQPRSDLVAALPWVLQLHVLTFFALLALFPFSRMVHILSLPLGYLARPWQIVLHTRPRSVGSPQPRP
jgi:nitrate reductase gamma subunit